MRQPSPSFKEKEGWMKDIVSFSSRDDRGENDKFGPPVLLLLRSS